jgi:hypothetical protein
VTPSGAGDQPSIAGHLATITAMIADELRGYVRSLREWRAIVAAGQWELGPLARSVHALRCVEPEAAVLVKRYRAACLYIREPAPITDIVAIATVDELLDLAGNPAAPPIADPVTALQDLADHGRVTLRTVDTPNGPRLAVVPAT